jgi:hypothetical protein
MAIGDGEALAVTPTAANVLDRQQADALNAYLTTAAQAATQAAQAWAGQAAQLETAARRMVVSMAPMSESMRSAAEHAQQVTDVYRAAFDRQQAAYDVAIDRMAAQQAANVAGLARLGRRPSRRRISRWISRPGWRFIPSTPRVCLEAAAERVLAALALLAAGWWARDRHPQITGRSAYVVLDAPAIAPPADRHAPVHRAVTVLAA